MGNDCNIALARGGDPIKVHFRRGLARKEQGNWRGAADDFEKVLILDPEQKDAVKERDAAYRKLGIGKAKGSRRMNIVEDDGNSDKAEQGDDFIASQAYAGSKPGFVFQMGAHGLGYYPDPMAPKATPKAKAGK